MLGLVLSLLVTTAASSQTPAATVLASQPLLAPAPTHASVTCPDGPASCDAALESDEADDALESPRRYATPAVIDCRGAALPTVLQTLVGECDGTPRDASYRTSRYPESEESGGALQPVSSNRDRDRSRGLASCEGLPPVGGDLTVSSPQPVAVFALPSLVPSSGDVDLPDFSFSLPSQAIEPLERPPRA
jgi:hypothetical protein